MPDPNVLADLTGRTVVLTGASSGIGAAAARQLAREGATVVPVGRSPRRTAEIGAELGVEPLVADFARLDDVRRLAAELLERCPRIDVLANNAGGLVSRRAVTVDGHEATFQVNHLAPFLLTTLLLDRLRESVGGTAARVITTASYGNRFGRLRFDDLEWEQRRYGGGWVACATAKLMNVIFTRELARRTSGTGIEAVCFHPGGVATRFASDSRLTPLLERSGLRRRINITPEQGAAPLVWLAASPEAAGFSGGYYDRFRLDGRVHRDADDAELAARLWDRSCDLVAMR